MDLSNIDFKVGSVNPSGIFHEVYFIEKRLIHGWPPITDDIYSALLCDECVQYGDGVNDNFILAPKANWNLLYTTQGKGKITWDIQGEIDCKTIVNHASLYFPKITEKARAFAKLAANGDFVFIVRHNDQYYVIGNHDYRAVVNIAGDSGDLPGSSKGITVDIECPDTTPLPTYIGTLNLKNGVLNCKTHKIIKYSDMSTNYTESLNVRNNQVVFNARGEKARIQLEGSGDITIEVAVDGATYKEIEHEAEFTDGVAVYPIDFVIGDYVRISAPLLTAAIINYSIVKDAERD